MSGRIAIVFDEANFIPALPRFRLTALPTPLDRASRLEARLRAEGGRPPRIYIKRDDLLSLAMGGNKIRNLEFSIGAAIKAGATDVVTLGRAQSNHCRLTAAACAKAGLRAHLVMSGARPRVSTGNLLLSELLGAQIHFTGADDRVHRDAMARAIAEVITRDGGHPHVVPVGGSDARGAVGHALAALEIARQLDEIGERFDAIALATATGGTQAGMIAGLRKLGLKTKVHGLSVHRTADEAGAVVHRLAEEVASLLDAGGIDPASVRTDDSQIGAGYGVPSSAGEAAVKLLARTEGLLADPVYTGKALAGLLAMMRGGRFEEDATVVFIHTGGTPALFADLPSTSM